MSNQSSEFKIAGQTIPKGSRRRLELSVGTLFDRTTMAIPVEIIRGKKDGPVLFVSAAVHGDEINGVEIVKRILKKKRIRVNTLVGTLVAVPIVNVFGFVNNSRYLPDRRDLNRSFPGSPNGSLAGQVAHAFLNEIVAHCTHGIDFHTGAIHRTNLPQIRACLDSEETKILAHAFGVPVVLNASIRDGSLRQEAADKGIPMLLFEGGEALRYEEKVIKSGVEGVLAVMEKIGMIKPLKSKRAPKAKETFVAKSSHWVRAPHSGSLSARKFCGDRIEKGDVLGYLSDPFGIEEVPVTAPKTGIIIGMTMLPLVNNGDALFHVATFDDSEAVEESIEVYDEKLTDL